MPALRVQPELRQAAEDTLRPGETLSAFVEDALRRNIELRQSQQAFIDRGLASREAALKSGKYVGAAQVLEKLAARLMQVGAAATAPKKVARTKRGK